VFQRHVLQGLKLPQNSALWNAESSLSKQERKLVEIDSELDRQTKSVQEKKTKLRDLRTKFIMDIDKDDALLQKVGPVYLDVILEGVEQDVIDTNKELMITQSSVDRMKTKLDYLTGIFQEQQARAFAEQRLEEEKGSETPVEVNTTEGDDSGSAQSQGTHKAHEHSVTTSPPPINTTPSTPLILLGPASGGSPLSPITSPLSPPLPEKPTVSQETLDQIDAAIQKARKERDFHWIRANTLIEAREKCKYELRQRKKDSDRDLLSFCEINTTEYQYLAEHRSLNELRVTRDFLSHDKIMAVNAREASKQEIKNIQDSVNVYQQRVEQEKNRKRKMRRQTWFGRQGGPSGGGGPGFGE